MTKFQQYVDAAKECGMTALGFSEHGSVFEWLHKKNAVEVAGMKYIHGVEAYLTETLAEKVRDNMHCVLIARNYDGFLELNDLISQSFNRNDNHFFYVPRISLDELFATSTNIIITTACIGGVFGKGNEVCRQRMLDFMSSNSERCFFEIGHHKDVKQLEYNAEMLKLSKTTGIRLIAGTDTHVLNEQHEKGREILQISKNIRFDGEDNWDLRFHDYDSLVDAYREQNSLPEDVYMDAINNTNVLADMIEPFVLDKSTKYPHIYENPSQVFRDKVFNAIEQHPYAKRHAPEVLVARVEEELAVYEKTGSVDFMLLQNYLREWEQTQGIQCGYGRGSVSGSMVAYLLNITRMDSLKFNLNFFRFMNPERVTNADIDTDYGGKDRDVVKQFLLRDKLNLPQMQTAEIITFNTIAFKGAIRDVGRALKMELPTVSKICAACEDGVPTELRNNYPTLFEYVDIVNGTIVSVGTHPSGVLVSDLEIAKTVGLCSTAASPYPVSMLNMKELDELMYVKLDILGLDNIAIINDTCRMLGIDRLDPDNVDLDDEKVWRSIRDDTTLIFQWESNSAQAYIRQFMSDATIAKAKARASDFSMVKWLSFGNGLIRPACASFRDSVARGEAYDNGLRELNEFLAPEAGHIAMQETIMQFLVRFCGYSAAESDTVRRAIAKKKGTESLLPEIECRFIEYASEHYGITREKCQEVIKPFLQVILDASAYSFSWNHSDPYSITGYICGYLRYYHPVEFLTAALNVFGDNTEKTAAIVKYASKVGIKITSPKFGTSQGDYSCNAEKKLIAKGLSSVKHLGKKMAESLYELSQSKEYTRFSDVLFAIKESACVDSRQLGILIHIDFFSDFGNQRELENIVFIFDLFKQGTAKQIKKERIAGSYVESVVSKYASGTTKAGKDAASWSINDVRAIIAECEDRIKTLNLPDLGVLTKVRNYAEAMGYSGYVSGNESDRPKLYIKEIFPIKRKRDGKQFGYNILTQSIGSGIESRFTVFNRLFNERPIQKGDVIYCKRYERDGQYFTMTDYRKIMTDDDPMEEL